MMPRWKTGVRLSFAATNTAMRLLESISVCVRENEPTLLVGETGCGKTTILQQLAQTYLINNPIAPKLALETDSTDLWVDSDRSKSLISAASHLPGIC
jgi:midasin